MSKRWEVLPLQFPWSSIKLCSQVQKRVSNQLKNIHCSILVKLGSSSQSLWIKATNIWNYNQVNGCFVVAVLGGAHPRNSMDFPQCKEFSPWGYRNKRLKQEVERQVDSSATICKCFPVSSRFYVDLVVIVCAEIQASVFRCVYQYGPIKKYVVAQSIYIWNLHMKQTVASVALATNNRTPGKNKAFREEEHPPVGITTLFLTFFRNNWLSCKQLQTCMVSPSI